MPDETALMTPAPASPAVIPAAEPAPIQTSVSADKLPNYSTLNKSGRTSDAEIERLSGLVETRNKHVITAPDDDPEPARLNKSGKTSDDWMNWMIRNLPGVEPAEDQPEPAPAQLAEFGLSLPEIKSALNSVGRMYESIEGVADALGEVYDADPVTYTNIFHVMLAADPTYAIGYLQELGVVPDDFGDPPPVNQIPADLARWIPEDLHPTAQTLAPSVLYQWAERGSESLVYNLDKQAELNQLVSTERERIAGQWNEALDRAEAAGRSNLAELTDRYLSAHETELNKWKPAGKNEAANNIIRTAVFYGAFSDLFGDPKFLGMYQAMRLMLTDAPVHRVYAQYEIADRYERDARQYAAQFFTRLGQHIRNGIGTLNSVFKGTIEPDAPAETPDPEPARLGKDGKTSPAYLAWVTRHAERTAAKAAKGGK